MRIVRTINARRTVRSSRGAYRPPRLWPEFDGREHILEKRPTLGRSVGRMAVRVSEEPPQEFDEASVARPLVLALKERCRDAGQGKPRVPRESSADNYGMP